MYQRNLQNLCGIVYIIGALLQTVVSVLVNGRKGQGVALGKKAVSVHVVYYSIVYSIACNIQEDRSCFMPLDEGLASRDAHIMVCFC